MENFTFSASTTGTPRPPPPAKPPEGERQQHVGSEAEPMETHISFRDKVLGNKQAPPVREKVDLIACNMVRVEHENGNRLLPKVYLDERIFQDLCNPWQDALVVKLLGKQIGYNTTKDRLLKIRRLSGGFDIMDVDNGFFMVKFDLPEDKEKVTTSGLWMIFDHYLVVTNWSPEFVYPTTKVDRTLVWIRFPGLNLVYYDESFLLAMASAVGRPIKVDRNTLKVERGRFARICIEVDLTQPVVGKVWLKGHWYKVEYEGLHLISAACGCYGHLARNCQMHAVAASGGERTQPTQNGEEREVSAASATQSAETNMGLNQNMGGPKNVESDL